VNSRERSGLRMARPVTSQPTASTVTSQGLARARPQWLLPAVLLSLYVVQCAWFIRTQSLTYDEPIHIAEGLNAWRYRRFEQYNDHPPLARLWCTLPLHNQKWQVDVQQLPDAFRITRIAPDPESLAWRARSMNVVLGLILAWLVWRAANQFFSRGAANFALALFVFSPSLIAHYSVATTDGAATLLIFAAGWRLVQWRGHLTWGRTFWLGLLLGLTILAKFSTAPMFVLAVLWMLLLSPDKIIRNPLKWNWRRMAPALVLALLVVWAGYFFHVSRLTVHNGSLSVTFPNWGAPIVKPVRGNRDFSLLVPAGEYVEGFREVVRHNRHGQAAFFLGQVSSRGGWKAYYPVVIALKWPTIVLALSLTGLMLALGRRSRVSADLWIMASFGAIYFGLAIFARFNLGERHVLPLYPFALLFAAAVWERFGSRRAGMITLMLLATLNAADALRYAPGYLSYFNVFVRPTESYRLLTDSNLDWGQGLLALREYQRNHPREQISLAYFGSVDPAVYGLHTRPLGENERVTGTVVVSATNLSGQFLTDPQGYGWLLGQELITILDDSFYVFRVPDR
jgi:Dolichyl-phosphate-mannose-protein mannosyltransferase